MSNNSNALLGLLAGSAIGATLGILFAPDKGINTRKKLRDEALAAKDSLEEAAIDLRERATNTIALNKHSLEDKMESIVSDVSYKTEDVINLLDQKLKELKARNRKLQKSQ